MTWTLSGRSLRLITAAGVSLAAIGTLSACRNAEVPGTVAGLAATPAAQPGQPMLVNCAPGQQPLIRQVAVNGAWVPQVECVTTGAAQPQLGQPGIVPAPTFAQAPAYAPGVIPAAQTTAPIYAQAPVYAPAPAPMVVERSTARQPATRRVVYDDDYVDLERREKNRSWQKSAIIIGSSAGVGAGVGAATGGKKGALIGAAIGGGAATIWDQATRRK